MPKTIEERLELVEQELELLKARADQAQRKSNWLTAITGSFKNDPDFDEILRLGREHRAADRPGSSR